MQFARCANSLRKKSHHDLNLNYGKGRPSNVFRHLLILFIVIGFAIPDSAFGQTSFTFSLQTNLTTSAGVYRKDGTLVRTLWNGVKYNAGTYTKTWDKKDDDGNLMPDGDYDIKLLTNNVNYVWEGAVGNTSTNVTGGTKFHEFERFYHMAVAGNHGYFAAGYNEMQNSQSKIELSSPNIKRTATPKKGLSQETTFVASDGNYVYWGGLDPYSSNRTVHYVYATRTSDDMEVDFGANGNSTYVSPHGTKYTSLIDFISGNTNATISGLAVQKQGSYLFVSHGLLNRVHILHKTTGAFVATVGITNPGLLSVDANDNLWIQSGNSIVKYTVGSGTISRSSPAITVADPVGMGISQDGGIIAIADASTHQVRAFYTSSGGSAWTLGQAGGYNTDATVTDTKFFFGNTYRPTRHTFIAFQSDGSFWLGDTRNFRVLRFAADRSRVLDRIMYIPHSRSMSVDPNNPKRVTSDFLEFAVDYSKPLAPNNGSWTLVKNWGYGLVGYGWRAFDNLIYTTTLSNGRTYSLINKKDGTQGMEMVELQPSGNLRFTGFTLPEHTRLYPDGSLRGVQGFAIGVSTLFKKRTLTGFDAANNPIWSGETITQSTPPATSDDPIFRRLIMMGLNPAPETSTGLTISYEGGGVGEGEHSTKWHLGALKNNKWLWRTAKGTPKSYTGGYPTDGGYDMGNGVVYPGGPMVVQDRNIFWSYHGEFWQAGVTNKWQHVYDNGLLVGIFGITTSDVVNGQKVQGQDGVAGMSVNALAAGIVKVGEDYYIYHCDESVHGGVHRWKVSGLNTIQESVIPVSTTAQASNTPPAPDLTIDDVVNTLDAAHVLGTSEILVSENGGGYGAYTGQIKVGDVGRAAGYWKFKIRAASGRPESAEISSPAFSTASTTAAAGFMSLPGKIEAENHDLNKYMVAENTNDVSGGRDMRYADAGDFMTYNVFVPKAGIYTLSARVVSYNTEGAFEFRTASGTHLGSVNVPNNFGLQTYTTVYSTIYLGAGNQTLYLHVKNPGFSLNWFEIVDPLTPATGYKSLPGKIEAESFDLNKYMRVENTTDAGGGQNLADIAIDDYVDYNVFVSAGGSYTISARVAAAYESNGLIEVRAVDGKVLTTINVPRTGGWQTWTTVSTTVTLAPGNQMLRLYVKTGGFNFNWFEVTNSLAPLSGYVHIPAKIEAEAYNIKSGMTTEATKDEGGGQNMAGMSTDNWLDYNVYVNTAGIYTFSARTASLNTTGLLEVRNASGAVLGTVNVLNTGDYQVWATSTIKLNLPAGNQTLRLYVKSGGFNLNWFEVAARDLSYKGIPGKIEAENYNDNRGIGIVTTSDASGGSKEMKYMNAGDWLDYNVAVSGEGNYTFNFRVASTVPTGSFDIRNASGAVLGTVNVPITNSWQSYTNVSTNLLLPGGNQVLRLYVNSPGFAINWVDVVGLSTPILGYRNVPARIEAETFNVKRGMILETTSDVGGGQNTAGSYGGDWLDYNLFVPSAGTYPLNVRLSTTMNDAVLEIRTTNGTVLSTITGASTGGWQTWKTVSNSVNLPAGNQTIRLFIKNGGFNINWFEILSKTGSTNSGPVVSLTSPLNNATFTGSTGINIIANASDADGSVTKVEFFQGMVKLGEDLSAPYEYNWTGATIGTYSITARATDNLGVITTSTPVSITIGDAQTATDYVTLPAKVEAERFVTKNGMSLENTTDVGGGQNMAYISTGNWLDYNVYVASAGSFAFNFRVASPNTGGAIEVRNASGAVLATITVPNTGGWQTWTTISTSVSLPAGNQTLRLYVKNGGFNLNWFEATTGNNLATRIAVNMPEIRTTETEQKLSVYPNPFQRTATIEYVITEDQTVLVELYTVQGILMETLYRGQNKKGIVNRVTIDGSKYSSGVYICRVTYGKNVLFKKLILQK